MFKSHNFKSAFGRELNVSLENKSSSEILTEMNVLAERRN